MNEQGNERISSFLFPNSAAKVTIDLLSYKKTAIEQNYHP